MTSLEQSVRLKEEETKTKKSVHGTEEERKREQGGEWGRENREGVGKREQDARRSLSGRGRSCRTCRWMDHSYRE